MKIVRHLPKGKQLIHGNCDAKAMSLALAVCSALFCVMV
jgi:hypothetical protein